jgi:hypothetical protein
MLSTRHEETTGYTTTKPDDDEATKCVSQVLGGFEIKPFVYQK